MLKKTFAIAVSSGILLAQAAVVVQPTGSWYWPFLDYPMYSGARQQGDAFFEYGFRVLPCHEDSQPRELGEEELGIKFFVLQWELRRAALFPPDTRWERTPEASVRAREALTRAALGGAGEEYCRAEVRVRQHRIDEEQGYKEPEWVTAATWVLAVESSDTASGGPETHVP